MSAEVTKVKRLPTPCLPPPPFPTIVGYLPPGARVETYEENTDPAHGIPHNEEGSYEAFVFHYSCTLPESATDLSAFMAGVTVGEKPVRLR